MNKEKIILAILLLVFVFSLANNLMKPGSGEKKELTYKTGERKPSLKIDKVEFPTLRKDLFPVKREAFRIGKKGIFDPLKYASKRQAPVVMKPDVKLPIALSPNPLYIYVGSSERLQVMNAKGELSITMNPPGIAVADGKVSPLNISCPMEGVVAGIINDGSSTANITITCDLRPEEKKLATYTFLGFLEKEKDKTIFLSRKTDGEILIVKKGDLLIKKNASISRDYVIKNITDDIITITSSDGSDVIDINLVENEPLKKSRKE